MSNENDVITLKQLVPILTSGDDCIIYLDIRTKNSNPTLHLRKKEITQICSDDILNGRVSCVDSSVDGHLLVTVRTKEFDDCMNMK